MIGKIIVAASPVYPQRAGRHPGRVSRGGVIVGAIIVEAPLRNVAVCGFSSACRCRSLFGLPIVNVPT